MSRVLPKEMELSGSIIGRLWRLIDRPMTIDQIEFQYVAKYGPCKHETLLAELHNLEAGGKIRRFSQGVYEP